MTIIYLIVFTLIIYALKRIIDAEHNTRVIEKDWKAEREKYLSGE